MYRTLVQRRPAARKRACLPSACKSLSLANKQKVPCWNFLLVCKQLTCATTDKVEPLEEAA